MFFTPTIYAMKEWSNLYLLVLSNGGYDGLGKIREREMETAAKQMGFKGCCVLDKADIPDGPHEWNVEAAIRHIEDHIDLRKKEGITFGNLVTFDEYGVSAHPNHISTFHACYEWYMNKSINVDLFILETVPLWRKYDGYLDILLAERDKINFFLPSPWNAATALMIHHSQFVWYRKLFMAFSRYGYFNSLTWFTAFRINSEKVRLAPDGSVAKAKDQ
jgi:N-acetylglucosaminylphosphatidylinositol deacetylase